MTNKSQELGKVAEYCEKIFNEDKTKYMEVMRTDRRDRIW